METSKISREKQVLKGKTIQKGRLKITMARTAGFCWGVRRAVNKATEEGKKNPGKVYMLGDIVHNEKVVHKISKSGIKVINKIEDAKDGTLLIRAHGTVPETYRAAKEQELNIEDATCPLVFEIHDNVRCLEKDGYQIIVIGDHGHDEVKGISGQVKNAVILSTPKEVDALPLRLKRVGVVVQSTQNIENVQAIIAQLVPRVRELKFLNTICGPTYVHQLDIRELPKNHDVIIVIGSFTSANTCRLTEISSSINPNTFQVEGANDLKEEWFTKAESVGVTAGASTPDWVIEEVVERLHLFP